jgi:hypothetical protein
MIVFSMLLMLCGQTLAGALMWCCLAGDHAVAAQPVSHEHAMAMQHHHDHAMGMADAGADAAPVAKAPDPSHSPADLLDCEHSCASSCSNVVVLAAVLPQHAPVEFALAAPDIVPALPQARPSPLLRPPNTV